MNKDLLEKLGNDEAKSFVAQGKLVAAGFEVMKQYVIPKDASAEQIEDMRRSFFMGAEHIFTSIMGVLDTGQEPTTDGLMRLTDLHEELESFRVQAANDFVVKNAPPG